MSNVFILKREKGIAKLFQPDENKKVKEKSFAYDKAFFYVLLNGDLDKSVWENKANIIVPLISQKYCSQGKSKSVKHIVDSYIKECELVKDYQELEAIKAYQDDESKMAHVLMSSLKHFLNIVKNRGFNTAIKNTGDFYNTIKKLFFDLPEFVVNTTLSGVEAKVFEEKMNIAGELK